MQAFVIEGGRPLSGTIRAAGNKNGALPILAACVLATEPVHLSNVPRIRDMQTMLELLAGYNALFQQFQSSSLPGPAKQVVLITVSVANGCAYCVAAHSTMALRAGLDAEVVAAVRAGKPVADPALEAVHVLTHAVVENEVRFAAPAFAQRQIDRVHEIGDVRG